MRRGLGCWMRVARRGPVGGRLDDMPRGTVSSHAIPGAAAWDAIVGERFVVVLAAPAADDVLAALAGVAADHGLALESLVAAIPARLDDDEQDFALVWWMGDDPGSVTAVVRGGAVVDLESPGGSRRFDGRGIKPWHLAEFHDVSAVRLTGAASVLEPVTGGTVVAHARARLRASAVEWQRAVASADADTVYSASAAAIDAEDGGTGPDGTIAASAPELPAPALPQVRVAGGDPFVPQGSVLIGRRPGAPRIPGVHGVPRLIAVDSPGRIVSSTHLELRVEGARLVASDLRSTNGTTVIGPRAPRRLRAGESIVVVPGMSLDLGDDTIVEILPPPGVDHPTRDRPNT